MDEKRSKISRALFYLSLILAEIGWMFVKVNIISKYCGTLIDIAIIILIACCLLQSRTYSVKSIIAIIGLIIMFSASAFVCGSKTLLLLLLFCLAGKNVGIDDIIRKNWKIMTFLIIIVLFFYFVGATGVYYMYRDDGTIRSSMGFSHPNAFGAYLFAAFSQYLYSNYDKSKKKWSFILIGFVLAIITAICSDSRGSSLSYLLLLLIITIMAKYRNGINKCGRLMKTAIISFPILLLILSLGIAFSYDSSNPFMNKMNSLLTYRISSASYIVKKYDARMFGQELELVSSEESQGTGKSALVLDNAYVKLIYQYGILATAAFVLLYCMAIKEAFKDEKWLIVAMLLMFAIRGMTENVMFSIYGNIFLLYFSNTIYGKVKNAGKD